MATPTLSTAFSFNLRAVTLAGAFDTTTTPTFYYISHTNQSAGLGTFTRVASSSSAWKIALTSAEIGSSGSGLVVMYSASTLQLQQVQLFPSGPVKNVELPVYFTFGDTTTQAPLTTGTATAAWTLAGGTQAATTNSVVNVAGSIWRLTLTAAECNGEYGSLALTHSSGATTHVNILFVNPSWGGGALDPGVIALGTVDDLKATGLSTTAASGGVAAATYLWQKSTDAGSNWVTATLTAVQGEISSLTENTAYLLRRRATDGVTTVYSNELSFTTDATAGGGGGGEDVPELIGTPATLMTGAAYVLVATGAWTGFLSTEAMDIRLIVQASASAVPATDSTGWFPLMGGGTVPFGPVTVPANYKLYALGIAGTYVRRTTAA